MGLFLRVGQPPGVLLRIRAVVDPPGMTQGTEHAEKLTDKKQPTSGGHVVVLVLDGGKRDEAVQWIHEFASRLAEILNQANKICELFVLLNKYDQAQSYYAELEEAVNEKLLASLSLTIGERANRIKLFPTILIRHKDAERLLDRVIEEMAFTLSGKTKALKESINKSTTDRGDA